jgi:RalA-binding protein 1
MAAMGDSPIASPQVKNFGPDSTAVKEDSVTHAVDGNSHTNGADDSQLDYSGTDGVDSSREFLESGDDASGEDDHESIGGERSVSSTSEREAENDKQTIGSTTALIRKPSADDFPMPPSHRDLSDDPNPSSGLQSHNQYTNSDSSNHHSSSLSSKNHDPVTHQFRALPLLATDLPHTKVQVSHSSIRPNDRGKEVLSFVIIVDPGTGKDPWRVEKLYSDVIALDQRVKSMSRSLAKKMPALPESKLWRDHAPAKVDQRKVIHNALTELFDSHIILGRAGTLFTGVDSPTSEEQKRRHRVFHV